MHGQVANYFSELHAGQVSMVIARPQHAVIAVWVGYVRQTIVASYVGSIRGSLF